jgi:hypothetical protein
MTRSLRLNADQSGKTSSNRLSVVTTIMWRLATIVRPSNSCTSWRVHEQGFYVRSIGFGEAADDSQAHKNRRAELYGNLRRLLDPERENGGFLLPPDAAKLRQELAILPLQYDSEGKMFLPPKDPRPNQAVHIRSLRQILGRSPDRADSLALAAWALRKPASYYDGPLICSGDPGDDEPLTPEDIEELSPFLRELVEESDALAMEARAEGDGWGGWRRR